MTNTSLTPEEVAEILKIKKNTVYELIKRGDLPAYRIGRKFRIESRDVEAYKSQGIRREMGLTEGSPAGNLPLKQDGGPVVGDYQGLVICGQDVLLDILSSYLARHYAGGQALRRYVGSFDGLYSLYKGKNMLATAHLWDGDSGDYNVPYVRRLLPGVPTVLVNIAWRMQGFYVAKGNPKGIKGWSDLVRDDIQFINREKGCGTRVLLDEQFRKLSMDYHDIRGYEREEFSHLAVASAVARGEADVGLGNEKAALQVQGIEFIPLQKERYDLVVKRGDLAQPLVQGVLEILRSREFQEEARGMGGYDISAMGQVVAEV